MRSAIAPVNNNGVMTANIISNFTNNTPGIVGAYLLKGTIKRHTFEQRPLQITD